MNPDEVITLMRHWKMIPADGATSRRKITSAVRYMMIMNGHRNKDLAQALNAAAQELTGAQTHRSADYVRRKINDERWVMEDLDQLAHIYGRKPGDYVGGYQRLAQLDRSEDTAKDTEDE
jgi:hypothetical protein